MSTRNIPRWMGRAVAGLVMAIVGAGTAFAQNSTGTIRGNVTGGAGAPVGDAQISARNVETGVQRNAMSRNDGFYVLPGLIPGTYDLTVRRIGTGAQNRRVVVQIGAT